MFETVVYSPLFGIVLSIAAFEAGIWIQKKTRKAICNPLVIAILLCIAVLVLFDIPLEAYNKGGDIINLFLGPATAVLALNIYNQMDVLKKHFWPVLAGCTAGSITSIGSVFLLCKAFGLDDSITKALHAAQELHHAHRGGHCGKPGRRGRHHDGRGPAHRADRGLGRAAVRQGVPHQKPGRAGACHGRVQPRPWDHQSPGDGRGTGRDERDFHRRVRDYHGYFVAVFVKRIRAGNRPLDALGPAPGLSPVLALCLSLVFPRE